MSRDLAAEIETMETVQRNCLRAVEVSKAERHGLTVPMLAIRQLVGLIVDIGAKLSVEDRTIVAEHLRTLADEIERQ